MYELKSLNKKNLTEIKQYEMQLSTLEEQKEDV